MCRHTWSGFGIRLISAVSVIKRLSLYEFTLWGRDLVSVVRIRESPYYRGVFFLKKIYENFVGTLETARNREVSVPRGSTVTLPNNEVKQRERKDRIARSVTETGIEKELHVSFLRWTKWGPCFWPSSGSPWLNLGVIEKAMLMLNTNDVQSTPDNSNLLGKSKKVRVSGSSKQITGNKKMGWEEWMQVTCTLQNLINSQCWTLYLNLT